ncbi:TSUP family transporter [Halorubrum sp. CBA1125]|uniref:sulfite exporter TauE/SafE family protein n=1 Tax=Halorubrum sp. CBA1125 TaxID=2668072 RepID=UPI0012E73C1B|nr:sulfite exporter TauE/SafE family protein [Halorubrum sp. CBA1125]MUW13557.1 TSUP family transporter [Halorubrum sp. CBA1125]
MIWNRSVVFGGVVFLGSLLTVSAPHEAATLSIQSSLLQSLPLPAGFPVDQFLAHWWVFPASILFSLIALASGVSGALFFSPFFMLIVGLSPSQAIGAGLLTEVFGMGNGLLNYVRQRVVDYATAKWLLLGAVPAVVLGAFAAHYVPTTLLKLAFGVGLLGLGGFLVYYDPPEECVPGECEGEYLEQKNTGRGKTTIETTDGETFRYDTCWRPPGVGLATAGGFITGLISAGLPEVTTTQLIVRCRLPPRVAVATSVFVLAIAAIAGTIVHALAATPVWYIVAWSIPGVLIGGTLGTRVGKYVPSEIMEPALGVVFAIVGLVVLASELLV